MKFLRIVHTALCDALDATDRWVERVSYEGGHHRTGRA